MIKSELVKKIDDYGDIKVSVDEVINGLLNGVTTSNVYVTDEDEVNKYVESCTKLGIDGSKLLLPVVHDMPSDDYLKSKAKSWMIPKEYFDIDIIEYLSSRCTSEDQLLRVINELNAFIERDQVEILHVMIYIVDFLKENNIVWGVGRGSSVASFCLYLIGINRINPLEFDIPMSDFFK